MMANGKTVLRRLDQIQQSLTDANEKVQSEINRRDEWTEYNEHYLDKLRNLQTKAAELEDLIREAL